MLGRVTGIERVRRAAWLRHTVAAGALAAGLTTLPAVSSATRGPDAPPDQAEDRWTIVLMLAGAGDDDPMAISIAAQLVDLPVDLVVSPIESLPPSLPKQHELASEVSARHDAELVLWFELSGEERLYLYLSEQERASTLMRELSVAGESEAGRAASVAVIVRGVVDALVRGGHLGVEFESLDDETRPAAPTEPGNVDPAPARAEPAKPPLEEPRFEVALSAAYGLERFSDAAPVAHAMVVGVDMWFADMLLLNLRYRATFPVAIDDGMAQFEIARFPVELGLRGAGRKGAWDFGGGIVYVLDIIERRNVDAEVNVSADRRWIRGAIGPVAQVGWRPHRRVRLWLDVGLDVHFSPIRHTADEGTRSVLRQAQVRPRGQIGVSVSLGTKNRRAD